MNTLFLRRVNVGQDATTKVVEGQRVIEFSVADNRKYKDAKGNPVEITAWYRCSYWTNSPIEGFLLKGASINVIGTLAAGAYLNKAGQPAPDLKVTVKELDLLDRKEVEKTDAAHAPELEKSEEDHEAAPHKTFIKQPVRNTDIENDDRNAAPF